MNASAIPYSFSMELSSSLMFLVYQEYWQLGERGCVGQSWIYAIKNTGNWKLESSHDLMQLTKKYTSSSLQLNLHTILHM